MPFPGTGKLTYCGSTVRSLITCPGVSTLSPRRWMHFHWGQFECIYYFPPLVSSVITKAIQKWRQDAAMGILVVPDWPTQSWFPSIAPLLTRPARLLVRHSLLLIQPADASQQHGLARRLSLLACALSGKAAPQTTSRETSQSRLSKDGATERLNSIKVMFACRISFVQTLDRTYFVPV